MAQKYGYTVKNKTLFVFSLILNQTKKVKLVRVHLEVRVERLLWVPLLELEVKIEKNWTHKKLILQKYIHTEKVKWSEVRCRLRECCGCRCWEASWRCTWCIRIQASVSFCFEPFLKIWVGAGWPCVWPFRWCPRVLLASITHQAFPFTPPYVWSGTAIPAMAWMEVMTEKIIVKELIILLAFCSQHPDVVPELMSQETGHCHHNPSSWARSLSQFEVKSLE